MDILLDDVHVPLPKDEDVALRIKKACHFQVSEMMEKEIDIMVNQADTYTKKLMYYKMNFVHQISSRHCHLHYQRKRKMYHNHIH